MALGGTDSFFGVGLGVATLEEVLLGRNTFGFKIANVAIPAIADIVTMLARAVCLRVHFMMAIILSLQKV